MTCFRSCHQPHYWCPEQLVSLASVKHCLSSSFLHLYVPSTPCSGCQHFDQLCSAGSFAYSGLHFQTHCSLCFAICRIVVRIDQIRLESSCASISSFRRSLGCCFAFDSFDSCSLKMKSCSGWEIRSHCHLVLHY